MSYFTESRCTELSVIDYIETNINADWSNINVVKSFSKAYEVSLPVIAIELQNIVSPRKELGNTNFLNSYLISINVFSTSDGMRIDLVDYLLSKLKLGCVYYAFSQTANKEVLSKTADGRVVLEGINSNTKLNFGENIDVKDRYRQSITISVHKSH